MRRICAWGFVTVALAAAPVLAQPQIESVELGFNGRFLPGALTPLVVTLRHRGPAQSFYLEVSQEIRDFTERSFSERLRMSVSLAPGARKTISLDFPIRSVGVPVRVALLAENREITHTEIVVRERWSETPITLGLAVGQMPSLEPIAPEKLPKRWTSYEGVSRIVWGRLDPARLSAEQRSALLGWLVCGGELVIVSGENWYEQFGAAQPSVESAWWALLLPITNGRVVRHHETAWLEGDLRPGARVVVSAAGRPVVWERPVGQGRVLLVALATLPEQLPGRSPERAPEGDQAIIRALGALVVPFPAREVIGGLLLAFVIGVGIGGMLATYRRRISLGIALAAVALSVVLFQYQHRPEFSHERYAVHIGVVRIWSDEPIAWEQDWYGVFFRRSQDELFLVTADSVRAVKPGLWAAARPVGEVIAEIVSPQTRALRFRSMRDSVRFFSAERMAEPLVQFTVNEAVTPPQIRVYNRSSAVLQDAVVRMGQELYRLGTVAAQTELRRPLSELSRVSPAEWLTSLPEGQRMVWQQWGDMNASPALIGWLEDGSVWAKTDREARTVLRLVTVSGG
ncbi:MAG: hypothetical protein K6T71_00030 [Candidatus Bipolaricaulota bacterium]|nr:hypothetical protein [Candidatus Bipolaricaulota bacterium]